MYIPEQYHDLTITQIEEQLDLISEKMKDCTITVRDMLAFRHLRNAFDYFIITTEQWPSPPADVSVPF